MLIPSNVPTVLGNQGGLVPQVSASGVPAPSQEAQDPHDQRIGFSGSQTYPKDSPQAALEALFQSLDGKPLREIPSDWLLILRDDVRDRGDIGEVSARAVLDLLKARGNLHLRVGVARHVAANPRFSEAHYAALTDLVKAWPEKDETRWADLACQLADGPDLTTTQSQLLQELFQARLPQHETCSVASDLLSRSQVSPSEAEVVRRLLPALSGPESHWARVATTQVLKQSLTSPQVGVLQSLAPALGRSELAHRASGLVTRICQASQLTEAQGTLASALAEELDPSSGSFVPSLLERSTRAPISQAELPHLLELTRQRDWNSLEKLLRMKSQSSGGATSRPDTMAEGKAASGLPLDQAPGLPAAGGGAAAGAPPDQPGSTDSGGDAATPVQGQAPPALSPDLPRDGRIHETAGRVFVGGFSVRKRHPAQ